MPRLLSALVIGWSLLAAGCDGPKGPTLYPVKGKVVSSDGKSLEHAIVVFHPVGEADPNLARPRGKVAADGTFTLTTTVTDDGAPAGEYRVTVEQWLAGSKPDDPPSNRLPPKYAKPDLSGLTATVGTGPNDLQPFTIKR